jgi:hypothetical protein
MDQVASVRDRDAELRLAEKGGAQANCAGERRAWTAPNCA